MKKNPYRIIIRIFININIYLNMVKEIKCSGCHNKFEPLKKRNGKFYATCSKNCRP